MFENVTYDLLNRVSTSSVYKLNDNGVPVLETSTSYTYDAVGNLITKSDVGKYTYGGGGGAGPHAVSSITDGPMQDASFTYDSSGRMLSGDSRTLSYDAFGQPATVTMGGNSSSSFVYTASGRLVRRTDVSTSSPTLVTTIIGDFEEVLSAGVPVLCRSRVHSVAVVSSACSLQSQAVTYVSRDRVGSLDVVTDSAGAAVVQRSRCGLRICVAPAERHFMCLCVCLQL